MAYLSLRRFLDDHLPLLSWLSGAVTVTLLTTIFDHVIDEAIISAYFLAVPLLAVAWLAAAAAEFSRAMNGQYDGFRDTLALLSETLILSLVGPFATIWLAFASDRTALWLGATVKLIS